jgi:hypothetical protein
MPSLSPRRDLRNCIIGCLLSYDVYKIRTFAGNKVNCPYISNARSVKFVFPGIGYRLTANQLKQEQHYNCKSHPRDLFRQCCQTKSRKEFHLICLCFAESVTEECSIYYVQAKLKAEFIVM